MLSFSRPGHRPPHLRSKRTSVPPESMTVAPSVELTPPGAPVRAGGRESPISVRVLLGLMDAVDRVGIARSEVLRGTEIDPALLDSPDERMTRGQLYTLCERVLDLTNDAAFGLHWAETLTDRSFAPISHLIAHSSSLRQALELLAQFSQLLADQTDYRIYEQDDAIVVECLVLEGESLRLKRMSAEMMVGGFWRLVRSFNAELPPGQVSLEYPPPEYADEYVRLFGDRVAFDQPFTGIVFDRELLSHPSPAKDDDVREALQEIAARRLMRITQTAPYATRVREFLIREGWPHRTDMQSVARALEMSVRSLRRRLEDEGRSYNDILNDSLATVAKQLFLDPRRTIQDIAFEMGFSDTSAFYRAFKRWTGMTPNAWREEQLK